MGIDPAAVWFMAVLRLAAIELQYADELESPAQVAISAPAVSARYEHVCLGAIESQLEASS